MGISIKKYTIRLFGADQIDVITNFAVITNVVVKMVHCRYSDVLATFLALFKHSDGSGLRLNYGSDLNTFYMYIVH